MTLLLKDVSRKLGTDVAEVSPFSGGDLSDVHSVTTADGRSLIAKAGGKLRSEARMLAAIGATGCPVPEVVFVDEGILIMTRLSEGRPGTESGYAVAGGAVAGMHAARGERYGWSEDHAFGDVPCPAGPTDTWSDFWAERRLMAWPDRLPPEVARRVERVASRMAEILPSKPAASLLHGDLWSGNLLFDGGFSGLVDPACYYGHAEVDLAMLTLFGSPRPSFWEAYGALEPGWRERRDVYQLWPALVHLRLFGLGYRRMVERLLDAVGA